MKQYIILIYTLFWSLANLSQTKVDTFHVQLPRHILFKVWEGKTESSDSLSSIVKTSYGETPIRNILLDSINNIWYSNYCVFYSDGIKQEEGRFFINNIFDTNYKSYYKNGILKSKGQLDKEGFKVGEWEWYDEEGNVTKRKKYKDFRKKHFYWTRKVYDNKAPLPYTENDIKNWVGLCLKE